jgi:tripartite-type tricarboxylate transporter receptor subunit TctC
MKFRLSSFVAGAAVVAAALTAPLAAGAQDYPNRQITLVVGFPPGGSTDASARIIQDPLSKILGQTIIIDNRGGAGGTTAAGQVAKAAPDGYTLLFTVNASLTMNMYLQKNFPFDTKTAFAPIGIANDVALMLVVNSKLPVNTVPELIDYAKKNPGKLSYGSSGIGSGHHICGELIKQKTGIDMVHVPYRGGGPAMQDLVAGNIQVSFGTFPATLPHVQSGAIKYLAACERKRQPDYPNMPTVDEFIPGVFNIGWGGRQAPAGTPRPIVEKLNKALNDVLKMPDVIAKMKLQGLQVMTGTPEDFQKIISDEVDFWGKVIPSIGLQPE